MGTNAIQPEKIQWWKWNSMLRAYAMACNNTIDRPGVREWLDQYEDRLRKEGRLSPLLLAALDEAEQEPEATPA